MESPVVEETEDKEKMQSRLELEGRGVLLLQAAIQSDTKGDYAKAVEQYEAALQCLVELTLLYSSGTFLMTFIYLFLFRLFVMVNPLFGHINIYLISINIFSNILISSADRPSTESEKALKQGLRTKMTEVADRAETLRTFLREQEAREKEAEKKEASTLSSVCVAATRHVFHASCTIQHWPRLTTNLTFFPEDLRECEEVLQIEGVQCLHIHAGYLHISTPPTTHMFN